MQGHQLERKDVDYYSVQDVTCLCEELVKSPAFFLVCFQNICKDRCEQYLQTPREHQEDVNQLGSTWIFSQFYLSQYKSALCLDEYSSTILFLCKITECSVIMSIVFH